MRVTTIGTFSNRAKTEMVINELRANGISDSEISSIYTDRGGNMKDDQTDEKVEDGAVKGVTTGAVVGALAGLAVANGILPGLGTIFVAGPMLIQIFGLSVAAATTVGGALTGALAGGIVGGLVKLGVSNDDAHIYEESLTTGNVLLITRTSTSVAKEIFTKNGAMDVKEYIEN